MKCTDQERQQPAFVLTQSEGYALARPRLCYVVGRARTTPWRDDVLLIRVDPQLEPGFDEGLRDRPESGGLFDHLLVMGRLKGYDLRDLEASPWPKPVYAMAISNRETLDKDDFDVSDYFGNMWAELYEVGSNIELLPHTRLFLETGNKTEF